jgi:hypothetical protein
VKKKNIRLAVPSERLCDASIPTWKDFAEGAKQLRRALRPGLAGSVSRLMHAKCSQCRWLPASACLPTPLELHVPSPSEESASQPRALAYFRALTHFVCTSEK